MTRALDGVALPAYFRRLGLGPATQELLIRVRSSPPHRTPASRAGNMPVWYPSSKMQCIIKAESAKVEFAFLLEAEHSDEVLEFFDQPPPLPLEYRDRRNHVQRPLHTADYFVFRSHSAGYEECKPVREADPACPNPSEPLSARRAWPVALPSWRSFRCHVWPDLPGALLRSNQLGGSRELAVSRRLLP